LHHLLRFDDTILPIELLSHAQLYSSLILIINNQASYRFLMEPRKRRKVAKTRRPLSDITNGMQFLIQYILQHSQGIKLIVSSGLSKRLDSRLGLARDLGTQLLRHQWISGLSTMQCQSMSIGLFQDHLCMISWTFNWLMRRGCVWKILRLVIWYF